MAYYYTDTDAGSDASAGTSWATAKLTLEGMLAVMSAGDIGFIQGATADTAAASRTFASPGTVINPCLIIGVVDGTTNEGASVVASDLASTLPIIEVTGAGNDITLTGSAQYANIQFTVPDRFRATTADSNNTIVNGIVNLGGRFDLVTGGVSLRLINTEYQSTSSGGRVSPTAESEFVMIGGTFTTTATLTSLIVGALQGRAEFVGVDMTDLSTTPITNSTANTTTVILRNCKIPASVTLQNPIPTNAIGSVTLIGCNSSAVAKGPTTSYIDYMYSDCFGIVDAETTAVRTGGANDGASGAFGFAMTPAANTTLESSNAALKSDWMSVWLEAGTTTLTIYIANDSASTDYNEDEIWCEFYTPDSGDTAQHEQTFDPGDARLLASSTIITDDTGSTWGTGANNHQKMEVTVTPGFEGVAYVRVHLAKRSATPDTVFVDLKIGVS